jgi:hypothetical protein
MALSRKSLQSMNIQFVSKTTTINILRYVGVFESKSKSKSKYLNATLIIVVVGVFESHAYICSHYFEHITIDLMFYVRSLILIWNLYYNTVW